MPSARHIRAKEIVSVRKKNNKFSSLIRQFYLILWVAHIHSSEMRNVWWWLCSRRCPTILYTTRRSASRHHRPAPSCTNLASASPFTCSDAINNNMHTHTHFAFFFASHLMIWGIYFDSFITGSAAESEQTDPVPYVLSPHEYGTLADTFHSRRKQKWKSVPFFFLSFLFSVARSLSLFLHSFLFFSFRSLLNDCSLLCSDSAIYMYSFF